MRIHLSFDTELIPGRTAYYVKELSDGFWTIEKTIIETLDIRLDSKFIKKQESLKIRPRLGNMDVKQFSLTKEDIFASQKDKMDKYIDPTVIGLFSLKK